MAQDNKISMPSGMGGLMRFTEEFRSKIEFRPGVVVVLTIVIIILIALLHMWGDSLFTI